MARKTVEVEFLKTFVNSSLQYTKDEDTSYRQGMIQVLEAALHHTGNYAGFQYLDEKDMAETDHKMPGIRLVNGIDAEDKFENTDPTRVRYF